MAARRRSPTRVRRPQTTSCTARRRRCGRAAGSSTSCGLFHGVVLPAPPRKCSRRTSSGARPSACRSPTTRRFVCTHGALGASGKTTRPVRGELASERARGFGKDTVTEEGGAPRREGGRAPHCCAAATSCAAREGGAAPAHHAAPPRGRADAAQRRAPGQGGGPRREWPRATTGRGGAAEQLHGARAAKDR